MEPKKNPKADLTKRSMLFFQIGMIVMLFLAWQAIEWKTYDKSNIDTGMVDVGDELDEEIPITQQITPPPPPPPPPPAPEVIEVVEDEEELLAVGRGQSLFEDHVRHVGLELLERANRSLHNCFDMVDFF